MADLKPIAQEAKAWLFDAAAPLWATSGVSANALFEEQIGIDGKPVIKIRRMKVQARQIYSFCEIGQLGWNGPWREIVERALDRLLKTARRSDGFFVHELALDGSVSDDRADLMDHAFVLFALAYAARALKRPRLLQLAHELMDLIEARWSNPCGGYDEGEAVSALPRRQNPHMHMFEAMLALYDTNGEQRWHDAAEAIARLCASHFIDPQSRTLCEYFTATWQPAGADGLIVEPGHCYEWAWLMQRDPANTTRVGLAEGLMSFAGAHGIDRKRNVAIYEVMTDGSPKDISARLWAQTERLKASLARWRRTRNPADAQEAAAAYRGLAQYLAMPVPGTWRDRMLADGSFVQEPAPASSLYHIVCALSELIVTAAKS